MAIKSKLRINQIQEGVADIDSNMLPGNVQTAAPTLDSEAAGSLEETLIKMMRNDQRRFGSDAKPGFDQTADIGVIAHFSAADLADVRIQTDGSEQKIEAIAATNYKMVLDAAGDSASLAAHDVDLLLDGANAAFSVGVEGVNDGMSIDKTEKKALIVSNANYKIELDSKVAGSEFGEFKVNSSSMKIIEAKEARLEVAADSRLLLDDVAKAATLTQGTYELQLDETNTEGHIHVGDVKIDLDNSAAKEINMVTGTNSAIKLDEAAQYTAKVDTNNYQDLVPGEFELKAANGQIKLSETGTSALVRTQSTKVELVEAKTGEMFVDANYGVKFDAQAGAQNMLAQANASKLSLDHLNTKARLQTASSFSEIIEDDIITHQVDANYLAKMDKTNESSELKAAASSLVMSGVSGQENVTLQAAAAEQLVLDALNDKVRLQSNTTFMEMTQGGMAEIVTHADHKIQVNKSSAGAEIIVVDSMKDIEISADEAFLGYAGTAYDVYTSGSMSHEVGGNQSATIQEAAGSFKMHFEADSAATSTDVFGNARNGEYVSLATDGEFERKNNGEKASINGDRESGIIGNSKDSIDLDFSVEFSKDTTADQVAELFAGAPLLSQPEGEFHSAGLRIAADKLSGDQNVTIGATQQESAAGLKDGKVSYSRYGLTSGIKHETGAAYTVDAKGLGKFYSEGMELQARGSARATLPTGYGVDAMSSLSGISSAGDELWFLDAHKPGTWSESRGVPLTMASEEWEQFEDAYGEVSLIGALVAAGQGGQDSFHHQIDVTATLSANADLYWDAVATAVRTGITAANIDGTAASLPPVISGSTSLDELKARIEVYVNGQRLQLGAGRDFEVSIEDRSANGGDARELGLKFTFALEAADVVSVLLK